MWRELQPTSSSEALSGKLGSDPEKELAPILDLASVPICICRTSSDPTSCPKSIPRDGLRTIRRVEAFGGDVHYLDCGDSEIMGLSSLDGSGLAEKGIGSQVAGHVHST